MKRTIFLLMSILLLLTACGDGHKQTSSDKEQSEHKDNHNKNHVIFFQAEDGIRDYRW